MQENPFTVGKQIRDNICVEFLLDGLAERGMELDQIKAWRCHRGVCSALAVNQLIDYTYLTCNSDKPVPTLLGIPFSFDDTCPAVPTVHQFLDAAELK